MSVLTLDHNMVIYQIVEAMLPRFSDAKLGLVLSFDMSITDWGYASDGNTRDRQKKDVRDFYWFLFQREFNYTKVLFYKGSSTQAGRDLDPRWTKQPLQWNLESDHDSCWSSDGLRKMIDMYFAARDRFKNRKSGGKELNLSDLSEHNHFLDRPKYVRLDVFEPANPRADRWSPDGRIWNVLYREVSFCNLASPITPDVKKIGQCGLQIIGSPSYNEMLERYDRISKETSSEKD